MFSVLHPVSGKSAWQKALDRIGGPARDPHFSRQYLEAEYLAAPDTSPMLAIYSEDIGDVIKPIVLREVKIGGQSFGMDVTSPHGYGGPLSNGTPDLHERFDRAFVQWCKDAGVICEYMAFNPMHVDHQRWLMRGSNWNWPWTVRKQVVWMDLSVGNWRRDHPGCVSGYHHARVEGIKAARRFRGGVSVMNSQTALGKEFFANDFEEMYAASMIRKGAAPRWHFPSSYVRALAHLGTVFRAMIDGDTQAMALVLHGGDVAYYHMAARRENSLNGANDLLVHEIALWCAEKGFKRLHLGGGVTAEPDDGVLFFKSGFSDLRAPAMSTFRVFNEIRYRDACAAKAHEEIGQTGAEFTTAFEPLYRREAA